MIITTEAWHYYWLEQGKKCVHNNKHYEGEGERHEMRRNGHWMKISVADYSSLFHYFPARPNGNDRMVEHGRKWQLETFHSLLFYPSLILNIRSHIPKMTFRFFSFAYFRLLVVVVVVVRMSCSSIYIARQIRCQINMEDLSLLNITYNRFPPTWCLSHRV